MRSSPSPSLCRPPTAAATTGPICARPMPCWSRPAGPSRTASASTRNGQPFRFEILLDNPLFERHRAAFHSEPEAPGDRSLAAHTSDSAQYIQRTQTFDYDMVVGGFGESLSPGQRAALVLGLRCRRSAGQPEPRRHQESRHRHPDRAGHLRAPTATSSSPASMPSTGCCSGTTTSSPISTWGPIAWPIGTSSTSRRSARATPSGFETWWIDPQKVKDLNQRGRN